MYHVVKKTLRYKDRIGEDVTEMQGLWRCKETIEGEDAMRNDGYRFL
jgi:hypothetical protein